MDPKTLEQEKQHLDSIQKRLTNARKTLEKSMEVMGAANLQRLKDLREDPQSDPHDLLLLMELMNEQNTAFNFKDKYKRLEESQSLLQEPYFSRIDLKEDNGTTTPYYLGKFGYTEETPIIIDWRAKVASVYYRYRYPQKNVTYDTPDGLEKRDLMLKRTYEIDEGKLVKYYNNDIQFDETQIISDKISKRSGGVLEDIIETIQESQLDIIEADPRQICVVQGCVGSGKSTVAIHKLSHIFFNFPELIHPERSILIAKNQILVGYLSTLFPKLGIFDINYKSLREIVYSLVFREELGLTVDFDIVQPLDTFGSTEIDNVKTQMQDIHAKYEQEITELFAEPEYETFSGFRYNSKNTVYDNYNEAIEEMEEELELQVGYLKENPGSVRAYLYKENIKTLKRLINRLKRIRNKIKETTLLELVKKHSLPVHGKMGYLDTLVYLYIYSELVGFHNTPKYEYCVLDEGQDFSILEYLLLGKIVFNGRFCILGDLNQSYLEEGIPSWEEIANVIPDAKHANTYELDTNYRSTKPIIDLANSILGPYTKTYLPKSINRKGSEPKYSTCKTVEDMYKEFEVELKEDVSELNKSIGIICYNSDFMAQTEQIVSKMNLAEGHFIKLDSKKRITYLPKGVYLTSFEDVKGLEFSKVYVLGLDLTSIKDFKNAKKAFVAVTRAMNELSVYSC
ncbi:MAG: hypothetical protein ACD_22C00135G0004 [uncultured bacterium]|nr:MAG: hypothetical protein ACD_22C00135G0004 [uncultured bacterium]